MSKADVILPLIVAALLSGCAATVTAGQPLPATSEDAAQQSSSAQPRQRTADIISPCSDLAPQQIIDIGLDPSTKRDQNLNTQPYEHGCTWKNSDVLVSILATNATVAGYENQPRFLNRQRRTVSGMPSLSFQTDPHPDGCSLISDIPGGGLVVQVGIRSQKGLPGGIDACAATVRYMEQAAPLLLK